MYEIDCQYNTKYKTIKTIIQFKKSTQIIMSRTSNFDWWKLSKLNQLQPNIQIFAQIIRYSNFGQQLSRVPISLRQKLLILFQKSSQILKKQYYTQKQSIQQIQITKKALHTNIVGLKQQLDISIQKINSSKILIEEKKKFLEKIKEKTKKKKDNKQIGNQVYFCPFCTRQDFKSRQQFSFHMVKQHSKQLNQGGRNQSENVSSQQSIPAQLKDLILSLKDKQIQLMQMMLNKKKQIQTMQLEQMYEHQIKKIKTQANFLQRKSNYTTQIGKKIKSQQYYAEDQIEELKGQSQYLFYQPQKINKGIFQEQLQSQRRLIQRNYHGKSEYHRENYRKQQNYPSQFVEPPKIYQPKPDYYNIFNENVTHSQMQNSFSPKKLNQFNPPKINLKQAQPKQRKKIPVQQKEVIVAPQTQTITIQNNFGFSTPSASYNNPIYKQNKQMANTQQIQMQRKQKQQFNDSLVKTQNRRFQSIYIQSKSKSSISNMSQGHIFNSGPLMDDQGSGSDYDDYFGQNINKFNDNDDQVADQQIRVVNPKIPHRNMHKIQKSKKQNAIQLKQQIPKPYTLQISNSKHSEQNQSIVMLQYSKDKSFLDFSRSNEKSKSSDMIQLSNSFSKRNLQSSKNDDTINLSDLKFSKLQRGRQNMRKQNKILELNELEYQKNIQYLPTSKNQQISYESNPQLLAQFKIQQHSSYSNEREGIRKTQKPIQKPIQNEIRFKKPQNIDLMKTNPGILEQFLFKQ